MNLADNLTKITYESFKTMALYHTKKTWMVRFNREFVSARKTQKLRRAKQLKETKTLFLLQRFEHKDLPTWEEHHFGADFPERV